MRSNEIALSKALSLLTVPVTTNEPIVNSGTNLVFACDVSYSMVGDLPKMRTHIKNKLGQLLKPEDTVTIIWFSGKGQAGILMELTKVPDLLKLKTVHDQVDKFLKPIGLTCFADPLSITSEAIERIKSDNDNPISFAFLSDGYNNDCPWSDVEAEIRKLEGRLQAVTIVEYGLYADSSRLSEMAESLGGSKIFAQDFDDYEVAIEKAASTVASKLVEIDITEFKSDMRYQFVYAINSNGVISSYSTEGRTKINVPAHLESIHAIVKAKNDEPNPNSYPIGADNAILAGIFVLADKCKVDVAEDILFSRGDGTLINLYTNAFGKQRLNQFKDVVSLQLLNEAPRWENGYTPGFRPDKNAYCVLDLIDDLFTDNNLILPYHEEFKYSRIGAKMTPAKVLSAVHARKIAAAKTAKQVEKVLDEIETVDFQPLSKTAGSEIDDLTWNEERANLSVRFRIDGTAKLPKNDVGLTVVNTFIFRNYAIIKDGILNMLQLPCRLTNDTKIKLGPNVRLVDLEDGVTLVDFSMLPVVNKARLEKVKAKELAKIETSLLADQAVRKYLGYLKKGLPASSYVGTGPIYSKEQIAFLESVGITAKNGYSPKTERVESKDFYIATALKTKIPKFSTLPKIEDVKKKLAEGKNLTASEQLIKQAIDGIDAAFGGSVDSDAVATLEQHHNRMARASIRDIAQAKFSLIMSRGWFADVPVGTPAVVPVTIAGTTVDMEFTWDEEKVKL